MTDPELDSLYLRLLTSGLLSIREAAFGGDLARCKVEAEHLHNLPSLVGESNEKRHLYYIASEKNAYLRWVLDTKRKDLMEFVTFNYLPYWKRIEEILHVDDILSDEQKR